ncbi:aldo/keto reductase [Geobacter sp. DSM 9736]|uniref:aldo/keto reductase n=1 Tax=Geobacter sp. DSM 9736 TaxID=1277350 RepID=UPI000B50E9BB|nr:aldo/keto reductase [Geobacter sp. DSM 9736]SNB46158.1 Predicted oxidoreductase [Geobacter sp. DSM 9736]
MKQVTLGATGLRISPLVYGTLPLGPLQAQLAPEAGGRLIRHALEAGVSMLDTAELYDTYGHIKAGLNGYRGDVCIATKTHANDGKTARLHVEKALRELGRDCMDIVLLHGARIADPFTERAEVLETLLHMKEQGLIRHVGLSSHYICAVKKAAGFPEIELIHPLINRTGMGILDGSAKEMAVAIAECSLAGKGVYAMKALAGGNLIGEARASFRYVLGLEGVRAVAVGMLSEEEIDGNVALFSGQSLDESVWQELESRRRRLVIMERFCKGCGFCVPACTNNALEVTEGKAKVNEDDCILCGYCAASCPEFMIRVV